MLGWYICNTQWVNGVKIHKTTPFQSLIPISGVFITVSFVLFLLAMLADMMGRHRKISEELLYLARRRVYSSKRTVRVSLPPVREETALANEVEPPLTMHDSWSFPVMREIPVGPEIVQEPVSASSTASSLAGWSRRSAATSRS